jgi:hypothetical protein
MWQPKEMGCFVDEYIGKIYATAAMTKSERTPAGRGRSPRCRESTLEPEVANV